MKKSAREKRNERIKKRYQVYRRLGYNSSTSRALSQRSLDVSTLEISKKTGKLKANTKTKQYIETDMREWRHVKVIDRYKTKITDNKDYDDIETGSNYSPYGMIVHDKRYKGETGRIISIIKNDNNLTSDQAYYFFYTMTYNNWSYNQTKKQLLTSQEFEVYVSKGGRK
jgi:hypothetical protein